MYLRISDIFTSKSVSKSLKLNKKFLFLGTLVTGFTSLLIVFITFYGLNTGDNSITMMRDARDKGIILSDTFDFNNPQPVLIIEPLTEINDMLGSDIDVEAARKHDGQYFDPRLPYYIAYTFYLKNSGYEMVNLTYRLRITESYKGIDRAIKVRYIEEDLDSGVITDTTYQKRDGSNYLMDEDMFNFSEGSTKKITIFIWLDGELTDESMLGGSMKLEMSYAITDLDGEDDD